MKKFAIIGNPIKHSMSPIFYKYFAKKIQINIDYIKILVPKNQFDYVFYHFFNTGGYGINITSPFKEIAYTKVHRLTKRAKICKAVNTIKKINNNTLLGDNTDGIGLIMDLKYLKFINKDMHVLIIGAGGAARSAIASILDYGCQITITNRTFQKTNQLKEYFSNMGKISNIAFKDIQSPQYNLIINATSTSINGIVPDISSNVFKKNVYCYDMFYGKHLSPFLLLAKQCGVIHYSNGLGMLAHQAAFAFHLWYNKLINPLPILQKINNSFNYK
uniref:Shikimate dehydrogenase (NADP(+)) n=1 Tax=Candidatus Aschnera chinzeii TaxID=1485666 RepID=A0AAT9G4U3_9ENTR|nr:MAG: shikimate dehydrogenase [Candidatus Aschnera chinzeii]